MGWWHLRLSAKILALLRLSANFFQLRLTKKLKINFANINPQLEATLSLWKKIRSPRERRKWNQGLGRHLRGALPNVRTESH